MERFGVVFFFILSVTVLVEGNWGPWGNWGPCSVTCAGGDHSRTRVCQDSRFCSGTEINSQNCNNIPCPIHGGWEAWESWTSCSATCGGGFSSRERSCDAPSPAFGGRFCEGGNPANIDNESVEWQWRACSTVDCQGRPLAPSPLPTLSPTVTTASPGVIPVAPSVPVPAPVPSMPVSTPVPAVPAPTPTPAPPPPPSSQVSSSPLPVSMVPSPTLPNTPPSTGGVVEMPRAPQPSSPPSNQFPSTDFFPTEGLFPTSGTSSRVPSSPSEPAENPFNSDGSPLGSGGSPPSSSGSPPSSGGSSRSTGEFSSSSGGSSTRTGGSQTGTGEFQTRTEEFTGSTGGSPPQLGGTPASSPGDAHIDPPSSAVHGGWGAWKPWTTCSVSCGGGTSSRQRSCDNPRPQFSGSFCKSAAPQNVDKNGIEWEWKICNRFRCAGVPADVPLRRITRPKLPSAMTTASSSAGHQVAPSALTVEPKIVAFENAPVPAPEFAPSPTRAHHQVVTSSPIQHRQAPHSQDARVQRPSTFLSPPSRSRNVQPAPPIYRPTPRYPTWYQRNPFAGTRTYSNWWVRRRPTARFTNYPAPSSSSSGSFEGRQLVNWW